MAIALFVLVGVLALVFVLAYHQIGGRLNELETKILGLQREMDGVIGRQEHERALREANDLRSQPTTRRGAG